MAAWGLRMFHNVVKLLSNYFTLDPNSGMPFDVFIPVSLSYDKEKYEPHKPIGELQSVSTTV